MISPCTDRFSGAQRAGSNHPFAVRQAWPQRRVCGDRLGSPDTASGLARAGGARWLEHLLHLRWRFHLIQPRSLHVAVGHGREGLVWLADQPAHRSIARRLVRRTRPGDTTTDRPRASDGSAGGSAVRPDRAVACAARATQQHHRHLACQPPLVLEREEGLTPPDAPGAPQTYQINDSLPGPFGYQSRVRTSPSARANKILYLQWLVVGALKSPSQQVRRETAVGEPF